jgi:hypothetical protein
MASSEDFRLTLPYMCEDLPAPLPTQELIESPDEVFKSMAERHIVRVGEHYVAKYGPRTSELEAEAANMLWLRRTRTVNVPTVYAVYQTPSKFDPTVPVLVIVMEFIAGDTLLKLWPSFTQSRKEQICQELRRQMDALRSLPPPGYFGGLGKVAMTSDIFWTAEKGPIMNGPFDTEDQLNNALIEKTLLVDTTMQNRGPQQAQFYRQMLPSVLRNHNPVFTHADFQRKNIIIRSAANDVSDRSDSHGNQDDSVADRVVIIDWEKSGWYPDYWEYCAVSWAFLFRDDWTDYFGSIITPWPVEHAWLYILQGELWS